MRGLVFANWRRTRQWSSTSSRFRWRRFPWTGSLRTPPKLDAFNFRSKQSPAFEWKNPQAKDLRRCSTCILPETFPFIEFDERGVCNLCRHYEASRYQGRAKLETALQPYRKNNGDPDCLVAFSGGRDSAYGLHYLVREMGMRPIAFTYDWGMVSDNGRRNQARVVGKLGVEHIIRSPDIRRKRDYIRMNLEAWLKRPDLGMIPLFSAGDKQFYHYGRVLRDENDIELTVFCAGNPFEMTAFKTGFCGIQEDPHGGKLWLIPFTQVALDVVCPEVGRVRSPGRIPDG